jgi:DNA-binding SARP family transcriptional activator
LLRGLDVDDLAEELYLGLMQAYRNLGRKAEAIKTYRRYQSVLSTSLGVEPSPEAEALYRSFIQ